jgi:hypothetical protein
MNEAGFIYQARSAYMAEFLRHWDVERSLENSLHNFSPEEFARVVARKQLLCGQAHQPEIAFFLEHGSHEAKVTNRAKRDAEALNRGGLDALYSIHNRNRALQSAAEFCIWFSLMPLTGGSILWGTISLIAIF